MQILRSLLLLGLLAPAVAFADFRLPEPIRTSIGVTGGYNRTFNSGFTDGPFSMPEASGGGNGFHVGIAFDRYLPLYFFRNLEVLHLHINLTYDRSPAAIDPADGTIDPWFVLNARGHVPVRRATSVTYDMVKLDLLLRQKFLSTSWTGLSGFSVGLGPTFGYLLRGAARHRLAITDPDPSLSFTPSYARTLDASGRETTPADLSIDNVRKVRYGIKGTLSYETLVGWSAIAISPSISFDYALRSQRDGADWRTNILQAALDVRLDLGRVRRWLNPPTEEMDNPL